MGHRKQLRRVHEPGHLHEFTFSCYQRRPLLVNESWLTLLSRTVDEACRLEEIDLVAFVFMPDHVHLLAAPRTADPHLARFLARIKQPFSRQIKALLETEDRSLLNQLTVRERPGKICFRFWQEGAGFDRNIFTEQALQACINYIHDNPCKRGLCERAVDWKWSSARYHLLDPPPPRQQFAGLPTIHGLREFAPTASSPSTGRASGTP